MIQASHYAPESNGIRQKHRAVSPLIQARSSSVHLEKRLAMASSRISLVGMEMPHDKAGLCVLVDDAKAVFLRREGLFCRIWVHSLRLALT